MTVASSGRQLHLVARSLNGRSHNSRELKGHPLRGKALSLSSKQLPLVHYGELWPALAVLENDRAQLIQLGRSK